LFEKKKKVAVGKRGGAGKKLRKTPPKKGKRRTKSSRRIRERGDRMARGKEKSFLCFLRGREPGG